MKTEMQKEMNNECRGLRQASQLVDGGQQNVRQTTRQKPKEKIRKEKFVELSALVRFTP